MDIVTGIHWQSVKALSDKELLVTSNCLRPENASTFELYKDIEVCFQCRFLLKSEILCPFCQSFCNIRNDYPYLLWLV